ncbi:MAG: phage/plasmid primase, P4 family [Candidatus Bathyarchaeota archaeon]|nr:phage/plasmid primase, P4 family [Candidatus Bathyarchaeota archaeon]
MKRTESKASKYFHENAFRPIVLAKEILSLRGFVTLRDTGDLYVYAPKRGVYQSKGETVAEQMAHKLLGASSRPRYIREACELVRIEGFKDKPSFKDPRDIIALKNGLLQVSSGKLLGFSPDYFFTSVLPITYDPKADCPNIKKFISEVVSPQDTLILQEMVGYCLLKNYPYHNALMLLGTGKNGKTTFLRLLIEFLGQANISGVALQEMNNRFSSAELEGKLANICDDLSDNDVKATGKFKKATGESVMQAERKFKDPFIFSNHAKMIFSANKLPHSVDDTNAYFERWIMIEFPNKFVDGKNSDPDLISKLTTDRELSGMLNWALEGLRRLTTKGKFSDSPSAMNIRQKFVDVLDTVAAFFRDCATINSSGQIPKMELYEAYNEYCRERGLIAECYQNFCKLVLSYGVTESRPSRSGSRVQSFKGIRLK